MPALLALYALALLLGLTGFLLAFRRLRPLDGGAWAMGRICGWVGWSALAGWPQTMGWVASTPATARASLAVLVLAALAVGWRDRHEVLAFLRGHVRIILATEAAFAAALAGFAFLVSHYPQVEPRSLERFQDFAFLEAVLASPSHPPEDPWFAGEPIPYYIFGHFMVALLGRTLGLDVFALFTPAVALVHALTVTGGLGLGLALTRRVSGALLGCFLMVLAGTAWPLHRGAWSGAWRPIDWFGAARAIRGAITEFPAFNILTADLHAHVIALPIFLLVLALAWASYRTGVEAGPGPVPRRPLLDPATLAAAMPVGVLMAVNPLDGLVAVFVWAAAARARISEGPIAGLGVALPAALLAAPSVIPLAGQGRVLRLVTQGSDPAGYLVHFGLLLGLLAAGLAAAARRRPPGTRRTCSTLIVLAAGLWPVSLVVSLGLLALAAVGLSLPAAADAPAAVTPADSRVAWAARTAAAALVLLLACEVVYVQVIYGPSDLGRTVTTNKLYLAAWLLMGAAATVLADRLRRHHPTLSGVVLLPVLVVGSWYPILGTMARTGFFAGPRSLSPVDRIARERAGEWGAIMWLRARPGREVVLEAPGPPYTWSGRIATLAGTIAPVAWSYHEASWRHSWAMVRDREDLADRLFSAEGDPVDHRRRLAALGVTFILVGELERERYDAGDLERLVAGHRKVFEAGGTAIYEVRPAPVARSVRDAGPR